MSKINRLATMNPREVVYRLREKVRSETERLRHYVGRDAAPADDVFDHFKDYLTQQAARRFYFEATDAERETRLAFIRLTFPKLIEKAVEDAERSCRHRVQLARFGEVDLGEAIDWHRDPVTGRSWPRRFWSDYDLVQDSDAGDPKVIHELNRHQHIVGLAKAYFLTGDERYSEEATAQMESWIDQNPPSVGVNWQSSLEIAIRAVSWVWTLFLLLPSQSLTEVAASRIGRSLFAQLDHIDRFPSLFSSPNTHLIGEATALFVAGTVFQGVGQAARWQRRGADWLIREMERQVTEDGVHGELSSYYHCYTVDFFLQALTLSKVNGFEFPDWMSKRLERMLVFVQHVARNDETLPLFGDDDGGRALAIVSGDYRVSKFDEEMFWLLGEYATRVPPLETHAFYPDAGYAVQRSGWGEHDSQVIFDCGGLGMLNGGHGHADALSIVLNVGGTEILTDPGTFVYNGSPEWRNFFRSTRAHNTVVVDDSDQSIPDGTFKWQRKAQCRVVQHLSSERFDYVEAEHDGYRNAPGGIMHRRRLLHIRPDLWVAVDDLNGPSHESARDEHEFDFYFHFPSNAKITLQQENSVAIRVNVRADAARLQLLMCASACLKGKTIEGQLDPIQGWVSPLYGEKSSAPALRLSMQTLAPASGMFIMAPSHSDADPNQAVTMRPVSVSGGSALACEAEHGDVKDIFVSSARDQRIGIVDFTLRGRFFWLRQTAGRVTHIFGIDCKEVRHFSEVLLSDDAGRPHFDWQHPGGV
jgi:uncharacterized heparinase superfamily protein